MNRVRSGMAAYFIMLSIFILNAWPGEFTYVPDDKIGAFRIYVDDLRTLQVSWYGINLLGFWPGIYNEGKLGYSTGFPYTYDGDWIGSYMIPTRDILVEVKRDKDRIEYIWGYNNKKLGCRQINRVIATPHKIISEITLEFTKEPLEDVVFFPSLFPGYRRGVCGGEIFADTRLEGVECEITEADGKTYKKVYPAERKPDRWLWESPRQIVIPMRGQKLRFSFSAADTDTKIQFYSHTGYRVRFYGLPSLLGRIAIPAREGFTDKGIYRNTIHLEIADGAEALAPAGIPEEVKLKDNLEISIDTRKLANLYVQDKDQKDKEIKIILGNDYCNRRRSVALQYNLIDYYNNLVWEGKDKVEVPKEEKIEKKIVIPLDKTGIFSFEVKALEGEEIVGVKVIRIGIVPKPYDLDPEESFFGAMWVMPDLFLPRTEAEWEELDTQCKLIYNLGIKRIRYLVACQMNWAKVEKEPGEFIFNPGILECIDVLRKNKLDIHLAADPYDLDQGYPWPEWVKGDRKLEVRPGMHRRMPKDISYYERYMFKVAKFFEGRIKYFELENEYICPRYLTGDDLELYYSLRETQARGLRRGNPDAITISSSFTGEVEKMLVDIQKKGYRIYDIYAPHRGSAVEGEIDRIKSLVELTKKYKVGFWGGEHNDLVSPSVGFRIMFPYKLFKDYEKEHATTSIKSDIIQKAAGVSYVAKTCPLTAFPVPERYDVPTTSHRWMSVQEIYPGLCSSFFGIGGNIKPNGVAEAVLASVFDGAAFKEKIPLPFEETYCYLFEREGKPIVFLWTTADKMPAELKLGEEKIDVLNIMGNKINKGDTAKFNITREPVYIVGKSIETGALAEAIKQGNYVQ